MEMGWWMSVPLWKPLRKEQFWRWLFLLNLGGREQLECRVLWPSPFPPSAPGSLPQGLCRSSPWCWKSTFAHHQSIRMRQAEIFTQNAPLWSRGVWLFALSQRGNWGTGLAPTWDLGPVKLSITTPTRGSRHSPQPRVRSPCSPDNAWRYLGIHHSQSPEIMSQMEMPMTMPERELVPAWGSTCIIFSNIAEWKYTRLLEQGSGHWSFPLPILPIPLSVNLHTGDGRKREWGQAGLCKGLRLQQEGGGNLPPHALAHNCCNLVVRVLLWDERGVGLSSLK